MQALSGTQGFRQTATRSGGRRFPEGGSNNTTDDSHDERHVCRYCVLDLPFFGVRAATDARKVLHINNCRGRGAICQPANGLHYLVVVVVVYIVLRYAAAVVVAGSISSLLTTLSLSRILFRAQRTGDQSGRASFLDVSPSYERCRPRSFAN